MTRRGTSLGVLLGIALLAVGAEPAVAERIRVLHVDGAAHGFVEITNGDGKRLAIGDLLRSVEHGVIRSELVMHFLDGSLDDETTVYEQRVYFRLLSDHHIQRGPSFPDPIDVTIDARAQTISSRDASGVVKTRHFAIPRDAYNGLITSVLMNRTPSQSQAKIAIVVAGDSPRIVHLSCKDAGEAPFTLGGEKRMATDYQVHVEIGGLAGAVAPIVGKQPVDYHVWLLTGPVPAFIRAEGQLFQGGPVWRIQQISAEFPK
jgi:hypothetical protein